MKKILFFIILLIPINVIALTYPELHYKSAIIYDMTDNQILYEKDSTKKADIASLTKIMTTITAIENIDDLNYYVKYTDEMASKVRWDASVAGLKVGTEVTYKDLLYASILPSGADATTALAISTSGSIENFVKKMNETAARIGMKNSHFVNVTGLDAEGHFSTAEDILILLKYAFQNELFKEIYTTKTYTLSNNLFVQSTLFVYRTNRSTARILGSKTGFTEDAGRCISIYFKSNNHDFLAITLGAPNDSNFYHILDALDLIDFIDNNYQEQILIDEEKLIKNIKVNNSKMEEYSLKATKQVTKYLPNDYDKAKIKIEYSGLEELSFNNKVGEKIGTASYYYEDELLASEDFLLEEKIEIDILKTIYSYRIPLTFFLIIIVFIFITLKNIKKAKKKLNNSKQKKRK